MTTLPHQIPPKQRKPSRQSFKTLRETWRRVSSDIVLALGWVLFFGALLFFHVFAEEIEETTTGKELPLGGIAELSFLEEGPTLALVIENLQSTPLHTTAFVSCLDFDEPVLRADVTVRPRGQISIPIEEGSLPCVARLERDGTLLAES